MARNIATLLLFVWVCSNLLSAVQVEAAGYNYSSNPDDYDFGWLANGTYAAGSEPYCTYCMNAFTYDVSYTPSPADVAIGQYWNLTVGVYRCDGVEPNEFWAYHEQTRTIVFGNLTRQQVLCIDAAAYGSLGVLKLRQCNASSPSQQWRRNGSRLVSAVPGPDGAERFMVAELPDKAADPANRVYAFDVSLNSSVPAGARYTADFTFLSARGLVNRSAGRFTPEGVLRVANASRGVIVNGGLERSTIQAGSDVSWSDWTQAQPSYFSLCGWVIDSGPIDYVSSALLAPAEGNYSVHLNTHSGDDHWGQVSQTIVTQVGTEYLLSFYFNGFPPGLIIKSRPTWQCNSEYTEARLQVRVTTDLYDGGVVWVYQAVLFQQTFTMDVSNSSSSNVGGLWRPQNVSFLALTNVTTISFSSLNFDGPCGPLIDKIAIVAPASSFADP